MSETTLSVHVVVKKELFIGSETEVFGESHLTRFATVFEDDGETGYFYALDPELGDNAVSDAMHIYNVENIVDKDIPSKIEIVWSDDGLKSALVINGYIHAVFDFESCHGYCRTNSPVFSKDWTKFSHEWSDDAYELFRGK